MKHHRLGIGEKILLLTALGLFVALISATMAVSAWKSTNIIRTYEDGSFVGCITNSPCED